MVLEIKKLQKKLNNSAIKNGVNSNKTKEISEEIDKLINEYYSTIETVQFPSTSNSDYYYEKSYNRLKEITKASGKFPTTTEWNAIAKEEALFSVVSMEYVSCLDWNYLRAKVEKEIKAKI